MLQPLLTCGTTHTSKSEMIRFQKGPDAQVKAISGLLNVRITEWFHDDCILFYIQSIVTSTLKKLTCREGWFNLLILAIQTVHLIVTEAVWMQTHPSLTAKTIASATWDTHITQCEREDSEIAQSSFVSVRLIYARSTSRHFGHHSRQRRHKSGWETHTWCSHTWNHILHLEQQRGPTFKEKGKRHHTSHQSRLFIAIQRIKKWNVFKSYLSQLVGPEGRCHHSTCVITPAVPSSILALSL